MLFKSSPRSNSDAQSASQTSICAEHITMFFQSGRQEIPILKDLNWEAKRGSIELLMGPSGSGKTTFLSILAGLLTPTEGNVYLLGQEITKLSRKKRTAFRRQHIGFIFQNFNLFPALTAAENVEIILNIKGLQGKQARYEAQLLLEQVGLELYGNQKPRDLSGGQKQRVAIARALAGSPPLIMADEPTAALDSQSGHRITELLRQLAKDKGCTVLIVTHDPRIQDMADHITYLEDGHLKPTN
ncbi:MAG: ABC transporter ATP-binding protein [Halothece sp.]